MPQGIQAVSTGSGSVDAGRVRLRDDGDVSGPERRIVEGEMYGAPVPGSWPGGRRQGDETSAGQPRTKPKGRRRWLKRLGRRRSAENN
jgi:hypothetical protein